MFMPSYWFKWVLIWGCSSIGRAGSLQGSGWAFESSQLHEVYAPKAFNG